MEKKGGKAQVPDVAEFMEQSVAWVRKGLKELKAPQEIIHIRHVISLMQYKYWILLLLEYKDQIDRDVAPDEKGFYSMPMAKLAEKIGYVPKKSEIWNDLRGLKNETLAFNMLNKNGETEKYGAGFISEWKVSNSYVRFKFPSFLEDVMRWQEQAKVIFSYLNWEIFSHFTGKYEAVIYKLCKDYVGVVNTPKMTIEEFRDYMGIKPGEYPEFKKLNARVVSEPVKRINEGELSDIMVTPHLIPDGRRIVALYFEVEYKKQTRLPLDILAEESPFRHTRCAIRPSDQTKYLAKRTPDEIERSILRANAYADEQQAQGIPVNYGRLYAAAILGGWELDEPTGKAKGKKRKGKQPEGTGPESEHYQGAEEQVRKRAEETVEALTRFDALKEEEKAAIEGEYLAQASSVDAGIFRQRGRNSPTFHMFLRSRMLRWTENEHTENA